jgi:hypothetical protein
MPHFTSFFIFASHFLCIPIDNQMEIDIKPIVPHVHNLDVNFVDDDELQAALASSHQAKVKVKKISPEIA